MRISPVNVNCYHKTTPSVKFQGKHSGLKWGATIFGSLAAVGAIGGSLIMTGGLSAIPILATYVGIGAGTGAIIGHKIDKSDKKLDKKA